MILKLFQFYNIYLMNNIYKAKLKWLLSIIHVRIGPKRDIALIPAKCDIDIVVKGNVEIIEGENGTK